MDAVVMAGGKGERMGRVEKPMAMLEGKPLLAYVLKALLGSCSMGRVYVAVSPNVPLTVDYIRNCPSGKVSLVMTPGSGYIEDMAYAARALGLDEPFLVVSADLPLITPDIIDRVVSEYAKCGKEALSVRTEAGGAAMPAGINVVHGAHMDRAQEEYALALGDPALAVNVNYRKDLTVCEQLLKAVRR
jgi:adenosylcobinamide-phosphate guanylyltransferase